MRGSWIPDAVASIFRCAGLSVSPASLRLRLCLILGFLAAWCFAPPQLAFAASSPSPGLLSQAPRPGEPAQPPSLRPAGPAFPVPGQPITPRRPAVPPEKPIPGEEPPLEEEVPPAPVTPPPASLPTVPIAPGILRYIPVPPAFTFLRQEPTYSFYLEQNPLDPPQRIRFTLIGGAQYDSNRDLKTDQKRSDVSVLGTLATTINIPQRRYFVNLGNAITYRHSLRSGTSILDSVSLNAAAGYAVSPNLSVGLTDLFLRQDNRLQFNLNQPPGLFVSTKPSMINTVALSGNYLLSPVSSVVVSVGNTVVKNEDPQLQNSLTERASVSYATALLPRLSLGAGYDFSYTSLSSEPSVQSHRVDGFAGYSLDSVTRLVIGGSTTVRLRAGPDDSVYYGGNIRLERELLEGIVCFIGGGFTFVDTANEGVRRLFTYNVGCTGEGGVGGGTSALLAKNLMLDLDFRARVRDTTDETVAVGLVNSQIASATLRYFPTRQFLTSLRLSASRSQLLETTFVVPDATRGNTFYLLQGDFRLEYKITTWLSAIGNYTLSRRLADRGEDLVIHQAFVGLSTGYGF